uniref:Uncharacterized protein n=1 Tax=Arundo donax TaxID=35708 RepID=A0A0A8YMH5_ARUDO
MLLLQILNAPQPFAIKRIAILECLPIVYSLHLFRSSFSLGLILNSVGHVSVVLWGSIDRFAFPISAASSLPLRTI